MPQKIIEKIFAGEINYFWQSLVVGLLFIFESFRTKQQEELQTNFVAAWMR